MMVGRSVERRTVKGGEGDMAAIKKDDGADDGRNAWG